MLEGILHVVKMLGIGLLLAWAIVICAVVLLIIVGTINDACEDKREKRKNQKFLNELEEFRKKYMQD